MSNSKYFKSLSVIMTKGLKHNRSWTVFFLELCKVRKVSQVAHCMLIKIIMIVSLIGQEDKTLLGSEPKIEKNVHFFRNCLLKRMPTVMVTAIVRNEVHLSEKNIKKKISKVPRKLNTLSKQKQVSCV